MPWFHLRCAVGLIATLTLGTGPAAAQAPAPMTNVGFVSSLLGRPADWTGDLFTANYAYPSAPGDFSAQPWMTLDPRKPDEREAYYAAVLAYGLTAFQGNIFDGCKSVASGWFHAPWMTFSFGASPDDLSKGIIGSGREPICGLTQERPAPKGFLHAKQTRRVQNWAVGMFNQPGGYVVGRIWRDQRVPNLSDMKYPDGTFIIKYLFSEATDAEVPYLKGSPVWTANVYSADGATTRQTKPMRLAQIDFAVRDKRLDAQTGWVFGTFMYANVDGSASTDWTKNVLPVGVMWGNDHGVTSSTAFKEQSLNPDVVKLRDAGSLFDLAVRKTFGWQDRVNGTIDNPISSCLSCHGTAQVHKQINIKQFITPSPKTPTDAMLWFQNVKAGYSFTFSADELTLVDQGKPSSVRADWTLPLMADFVSTDYSLQIRMGIETARAYSAQQALAAIAANKAQAPKAFAKKLTGLDQLHVDYRHEFRRIEREGLKP